MSDELYKTVKIKLDRKAGKDDDWKTVEAESAEETEFSLVSTMMLKQILDSDDDEKKDQIRGLTDEQDGILACATGSDEFRILPDDKLNAALKAESSGMTSLSDHDRVDEYDGEEDMSLVSTQMLRTILHVDDEDGAAKKGDAAPKDDVGTKGYNPYNKKR